MRDERDKAIQEQLGELTQMPTVSPFCRTFYQLIAQYTRAAGGRAEGAGHLLASFLNVELRYHGQLAKASRQDHVHVGDLQSMADKRWIGLAALAEEAAATRGQAREDEIARQLILAECYYHADQTEKVVAHLEAAAEDDSDQPLIQFALGYNRYLLAIKAFLRPTDKPGEWLTADYLHFQRTCLQAASAFEKVVSAGHSNAHIYQWLGTVLATAGFEQAADQAFLQAQQAEQGNIDETDLAEALEVTRELDIASRPSALPPITQAEIDRVRELLIEPLQLPASWFSDDQSLNN